MGIENPVLDTDRRLYEVVLNHKTIQPAGDLVLHLEIGLIPIENTDQCVQDFIDLVNGSEHFLVAVARKTTPSVEQISATA